MSTDAGISSPFSNGSGVTSPFANGSGIDNPFASGGAIGSFENALSAAPGLAAGSPGLVMDAAGSSDPSRAAIVLAQGANLNSAQVAADAEHSDGGGGHGLMHWLARGGGKVADLLNKVPGEEGVENAAGGVLHALSKPVAEVGDDYAYLHKVWTNHGIIPGLLATLGVAAGGTIGFFLGGQVTLGAEIAAAGERQLAKHGAFGEDYKQDAIDAETAKISPGRDVSNLIGQVPGLHTLKNTDSGYGKYLSGGVDLAAMFKADPIAKALKLKGDIHTGEFAVQAKNTGLGDWAATHTPGFRITTGESLDNLRASTVQGSGYRRAINEIAGMSSADIVARYPQLESLAADEYSNGSKVWQGLGAAKTPDQVHDVFRNVAEDADFQARLKNMATLPSKSLTRVPFSAAAEKLRQTDASGEVGFQRNLVLPRKVGEGVKDYELPALLAPKDLPGAVAKKIRTFSGYMPFALHSIDDKGALALSTKTFSPSDALANVGVYRTFKYAMGEQRARYWTDRFINSKSESEAQSIWAEGQVELYKAAGLPEDNFLVQNLRQRIHDLSEAPMTEPKSVYGVGLKSGTDVSTVALADRTDTAALWSHQAGQYTFPDFLNLKKEMRALDGTLSNFGGRADDFIANHFTNNWFKPLALLTAGFGMRVAAAEALPAAMRYGAMNMLRGQVSSQAAKRNWRLSQGEDGHLLSATSRIFGGMEGLVRATPEDRELAMDLVHSGDGQVVVGVGRTGHDGGHAYSLPDEIDEKMRAATYYTRSESARDPRTLGSVDRNFDTISRDNATYTDDWITRLQQVSQEVPASLIAQDLTVHGLSREQAIANEAQRIRDAAEGNENAITAYLHEADKLKRYSYVQSEGYHPETFAENRVDALEGLTTGESGLTHNHLLEKIANREKPTVEDVKDIGKTDRPLQVYGPLRIPYMGNNIMGRVIQSGFKRVVDPIINNISREPIFFNAVKEEMGSLKHFVDEGTLEYDTALRIAKTRASVAMLPQIHNVALRSQFAQLARNFLPFYFAQEQAIKRVGYLSAVAPKALRDYQLLEHSLNEPGFIHGDNESGKYLAFPLLGALGVGAQHGFGLLGVPIETALPVSVSGNMSSLKTVLPELQAPGVSPLAAISLNTIANLFPELRAPVHAVVGDVAYGQGALDALLPNTFLRNTFKALHPDEKDRSFGNAFLGAMAQAYYEGKMPGADASPSEKAAFVDRIKNNTRSAFFVKAILGLVSPLAPAVSNEDPEFRQEFLDLVKQKGYKEGLNEFLDKHGDQAISFTVARSQPAVKGASMPYTQQAIDWINNNTDLVSGPNATGAAFLVPQDPGKGDVGLIHDELLKMHLRERDTPEDFRTALYEAMGNRAISNAREVHEKALADVAGNKSATAAENANWSTYVQSKGLANPIWWDAYQSQDRTHTADLAYRDLLQIFQSPKGEEVLNTNQGQLVGGLVAEYQAHLSRLAQYGTSRTAQAQAGKNAEKQQWEQFLTDVSTKEPRLQAVVQTVFSRLDPTLGV